MVTAMMAQPAKRRTTTPAPGASATTTAKAATDRASLMFPTQEAMPEDVTWRRDLYRVLNLLDNDKNAVLYYPVQPIGKQRNLFSYLFRLVLTGRVTGYKYTLDGNETFTDANKVSIREMLDNYSIFYEEKDGKYQVADIDVPSEFVKRYYIKESIYLDRFSNDTRAKVTAICPVLMQEDDFGDVTPTPLFWLRYDDVAPYLAKLPVMTSNLNNVTNMTADDYFTLNRYEGQIYKTSNLQGRILMNYCQTDSALHKEQARIEKELTDFQDHLWTGSAPKKEVQETPADTKSAKKDKDAEATEEKATEEVKEEKEEPKTTSRRSTKSTEKKTTEKKSVEKKQKTTKAPSNAARVSVRRERR